MPSAVKVVFNADTGQFVANVDGATKSVAKQAEAVANAKNKILDAYKAQTQAAKTTGATSEDLERIHRKASESLANVTEKNAGRVVAALDRIIEKQKRVAAEATALGNAPVGAHGDDITNKQRASALLRGGGIRAGESFLTQFDAFNKLSAVAFPVLGLAAVTKEAYQAVEAFKAMHDSAEKLPSVIEEGFDALNEPLIVGVDNLRKVNDELEITNAHLAHKPANLTALALDEIVIEADRVYASTKRAFEELQKLFAENKSGALNKLLFDKGETGGIAGDITRQLADLTDLDREHRNKVREGISPQDEKTYQDKRAKMLVDRRKYIADQRRIINGQVDDVTSDEGGNTSTSRVKYSDKYGNQDTNNAYLNGYEDLADNTEDDEAERKRNTADQIENKRLTDAEKRKQQAAEAQRKAQEEQRKADQKRYDTFKTQEDVLKEFLSPEDVARDWDEFSKTYKAGSEKANEAVREAATNREAADRSAREAAKRAAEQWQKSQRSMWDMDHNDWVDAGHRTAEDEETYWSIRALEADRGSENERQALDKAAAARRDIRRRDEEATKAQFKAGVEHGQQSAAYAEASVAIQLQTGQISKLDAAQQLANIHAEQYRLKMQELADELKRQQDLDPKSAGTVNAQAAQDKAEADRRIQIMQDAAHTAAETWQGSLRNANAAWVQDAQDSAKQVAEFYRTALDGVNSNLVSLLTSKHGHGFHTTDWKGLGENLAKQGTGVLLKRAEAPILGALGLKKADGSKGTPFHVWVENQGGSAGGGAAASFAAWANPLSAAMDGSSSKTASAISSLADGALSLVPGGGLFSGLFGGHRALGGGVKAGMSYDVGEMGRETFTPTSDGYITPANKAGGNGASYTVNVANGVTPEQMRMHVRQALQEFHPQVVASSVAAVKANQARYPSSQRG